MRKILLSSVLLLSAMMSYAHHTPAHIEEQVKGLMPVKTALKQIDHTPVILKGYIVESKGKGTYLFKDSSGKILVNIKDNLLNGKTIDKNKAVTLVGELSVDKSYQPRRVSVNVVAVK